MDNREKNKMPIEEIIKDYNTIANSAINKSIYLYCEELKGKTIMDMENKHDVLLFQPINEGAKPLNGFFGEIKIQNIVMYCEFDQNRICIKAFFKEALT